MKQGNKYLISFYTFRWFSGKEIENDIVWAEKMDEEFIRRFEGDDKVVIAISKID